MREENMLLQIFSLNESKNVTQEYLTWVLILNYTQDY